MSERNEFFLQLKKFKENTITYWQELRHDSHFSDVTLACVDKQVNAHRLVLSASSPVLKNILIQNPHQNPVTLNGVKYSELISILDFIYLGQVTIDEEQLNDFFAVANDLQIKGLANENEKVKNKLSNYQNNKLPKCSENNAVTEVKTLSDEMIVENIETHSIFFDEPKLNFEKKIAKEVENNLENNDKNTNTMENISDAVNNENMQKQNKIKVENIKIKVDEHKQETIQNGENLSEKDTEDLLNHHFSNEEAYLCEQCDYNTNIKDHLRKHVLAIHEGFRNNCDQCDYKTGDKSNLIRHRRTMHEGMWYFCEQCDYSARDKNTLKKHKLSKHEGVRYQCGQCEFKAKQKAHLNRHISKKH